MIEARLRWAVRAADWDVLRHVTWSREYTVVVRER